MTLAAQALARTVAAQTAFLQAFAELRHGDRGVSREPRRPAHRL